MNMLRAPYKGPSINPVISSGSLPRFPLHSQTSQKGIHTCFLHFLTPAVLGSIPGGLHSDHP